MQAGSAVRDADDKVTNPPAFDHASNGEGFVLPYAAVFQIKMSGP